MNILLACWVIGLANLHCNSHVPVADNKRIDVSFFVDGKALSIGNNFSIKFIRGGDTLSGEISDSTVNLPTLDDSTYDVLFKYEFNALFFPNVRSTMIIPKQNMRWIFGIQNRPFTLESGLLSKEDYDNDSITKYLVYWKFDPEESGDGIQIVQKKLN